MPESLVTCPVCLTPNFTPRGLKAHKHKCKGGTRLNRQTGLVEVIEPAKPESPLTRRARELRAARTAQITIANPVETPTQKRGGKACKLTLPDSLHSPCVDVSEIQIADPKAILCAARSALEKHREIIIGHEEKFAAASLGPRLQMGLSALQAYQVFLIKDPKKIGAMKGQKKRVTRDTLLEQGFEGWIDSECPWFKRVTAYKYMTAVRGLGLDHSATEKQVAAALKLRLRKGPVTLKSLCDSALEALGPPPPPEQTLQQSEFQFLVDGLKDFRSQAEHICSLKTQLLENPDMYRVACARAYSILFELTGTNWAPSNEPDALALVNPDSIIL